VAVGRSVMGMMEGLNSSIDEVITAVKRIRRQIHYPEQPAHMSLMRFCCHEQLRRSSKRMRGH